MIVSILHRQIFFELTRIFLMSLFGITGILVMAGLIQEATQQGLGPAQVLMAIPLLIPNTLPYTIPATTLFATPASCTADWLTTKSSPSSRPA